MKALSDLRTAIATGRMDEWIERQAAPAAEASPRCGNTVGLLRCLGSARPSRGAVVHVDFRTPGAAKPTRAR
jgi:hypothetical protein